MSNLEYEIRVYDISERKIKKLIKEKGGKLINKKKIMPIITYHHPLKKKDSYIRIRDEGKQITMTIKTKLNTKYKVEREVEIDNIEEGDAILKFLGCKKKYTVEKIRETYVLPGAKEIVFDSYPGIPTYLEIDCHDLKSLKKVCKMLGFTVNDHDTKGINDLYFELYGIKKKRPKGDLTFKNANKVFGHLIKKNKKDFYKILKKQKMLYKK